MQTFAKDIAARYLSTSSGSVFFVSLVVAYVTTKYSTDNYTNCAFTVIGGPETYYNIYKYLLQLSTSNIVARCCSPNVIHNWFRRSYRISCRICYETYIQDTRCDSGLILCTLMYFQAQNLISVNWDRLQSMTQGLLSTLAHSLTDTGQISTITGNLGIPLTGGLAAGFAIGVMKG